MNKIVKRILITLITISIIATGIALFLNLNNFDTNRPCAFCNPEVIKAHTFYEDKYVIGMCSHRQVKPWHCLVVIKRHIKNFDDISDKELIAAGKLLKRINLAVQKIIGPASYIILEYRRSPNFIKVADSSPNFEKVFSTPTEVVYKIL